MRKLNSKGFTLVELLIVIAIIAIIAGAIFVALNPLQRFQDSRDARRWSDAASILSAIKVNQVDNKGTYMFPIASTTLIAAGTGYMIDSVSSTSCSNVGCTALVTSPTNCINLKQLVDAGYLGSLPISPSEGGNWSADSTGYVLTRTAAGAIKIQACEVGNPTNNVTISVTR